MAVKQTNENEPALMKIGEIAAFFQVSQKAIRLYEKKGIIIPEKIDASNGYRYYTAAQVEQLNALLELKSYGFTLSEIKAIMDGGIDEKKLHGYIEKKKKKWQESIALAESKIEALNNIAGRIASSKEVEKITDMTTDQRAWLLVKVVCSEDSVTQHLLSEALWL